MLYRKYCEEKGYIDTPVSAKSLSKKWANLKFKAKQKASKFKVELRKTGNGPPPKPLDSETEEVLATIYHQVEISNPFDSETSASQRNLLGETIATTIGPDFLSPLDQTQIR